MASTVWKGHLTFGLVSIPVKLIRAARAERVSFRQIHAGTGARLRQTYVTAGEPATQPTAVPEAAAPAAAAPLQIGRGARPAPIPIREVEPVQEEPVPAEIPRSEIAKGYEYAKDQFVTLTKEELAKLTPKTAKEMQILECVKLADVDPVYFETSYYLVPDRGGERPYSLLFAALRESELAAVAQLAMHNREHIVLVRTGRSGLILHTLFYETEVHQDDEYRADVSAVSDKELGLAKMLVESLSASFEPGKYHDAYREKVEALIQAKIAGQEVIESAPAKPTAVVNILEALQRSLERVPPPEKKPAARQEEPGERKRKRK